MLPQTIRVDLLLDCYQRPDAVSRCVRRPDCWVAPSGYCKSPIESGKDHNHVRRIPPACPSLVLHTASRIHSFTSGWTLVHCKNACSFNFCQLLINYIHLVDVGLWHYLWYEINYDYLVFLSYEIYVNFVFRHIHTGSIYTING